jgi:hypothetical protein
MRSFIICVLAFAVFASTVTVAAEKYNGPRPPKTDVPYLMHADTLIETEAGEAREETRKDATVATLPGTSSPAKTPLAEPIFLLKADRLIPDKIAAYKMEVRNGNREVVISQKKGRNIARPIYLNVTRLGDGLYRIEVDQQLENGQYVLSPEGSNQTFGFEVY